MGLGMPRTVYVNGEYVPEEEAQVSVFDRGFLMGDAVYEVTGVLNGKLVDFEAHLARLHRSMNEIDLTAPVSDQELEYAHRELVRRNQVTEGIIYMQLTRGPAERDFLFPDRPRPNLIMFTQGIPIADSPARRRGISVITVPDLRWGRRDIKTVQLLAASISKVTARRAGKDDAWMVENGFVTEGTSSNAFIVDREGTVVTRDTSTRILAGVTRAALLTYAREANVRVEERPFTTDEARGAAEAFITATTSLVIPVVEIDDAPIGGGTPGPATRRLQSILLDQSRARAT